MFSSLRKDPAAGSSAAPATAPAAGGNSARAAGDTAKRGRLATLPDAAPAAKRASPTWSLPAVAPLVLDVHPYGSSAEDQVAGWPMGMPCWQVQITHEAYPSMTAFFREAFESFLAGDAKEEGAPKSLKELQQQCFFRVQITRENSEVNVPLVPWRLAIYIAGRAQALTDMIGMLKAYARHRAENAHLRDKKTFPDPGQQKIEVYLGIGCPHFEMKEAGNVDIFRDRNLYKWCEAAGPEGNKFLFLDVEVEETGTVALGWRGRTWTLRNAFESADITLAEDGNGGFIRVLSGDKAAISSKAERESIIEIMKGGLNYAPCIVNVEAIPEDDAGTGHQFENARAFVDALRGVPHLHVQRSMV